MQKRLTKNILWVLFERVIQTTAGLAIAAMLARALGVEGFGLFQYAQSWVLIAAAATLVCGAEVAVPRLVACSTPRAQHGLLRHLFFLRSMAAVLAYTGLIAAIMWLTHDRALQATVAVLGLSVLLREPFGVVIAWLQAQTNHRPVVIIALSALLIKTLTIGILYALDIRALPAYASALALESLVVALCLAALYLRRQALDFSASYRTDPNLAQTLLRDGTLFWLAMLLMMATRRVDQLLLKPAVPLADLGAYAASMQLLDNVLLLATVVVNVLAPMMVYAQTDRALSLRRVWQLALGMGALGIACGVLLAALAPWVVHLLYGSAFFEASALLRVLALAIPFLFADAALTLLAVKLRRPGWIVGKWLVALLLTILIDSVMIPLYGTYGAAIGYLWANAGAALIGVIFLIHVWRTGDQG